MSEQFLIFLIFFSTVTVLFTHSVCSTLLALHFVNSHLLVTCDRPSSTVLVPAKNDLFDITQERLFGQQNLCRAKGIFRQLANCCFMRFTANQLMICLLCKQLAGAADDSTHTHTARYATDDNTEVM